ncbi:MAG: flippase-like domain-containing protein [Myxococcales bacterium]|nr:flippase-like domain-containing protein [Myxococcales bacterium]
MSKAIKAIAGIVISAVFLYFAFRGLDFQEVWTHMQSANYFWLGAVALATLYANWVRAQRWDHFFRHLKRIPMGSLFSSTMVGMAANNVLPLRIGEVVRAVSISKKEREIPLPTAFTTILLERMFDMVMVLIFLGLTLALVPIPESAGAQVAQAAKLLGAIAGVVVVAILFLFFKQELMVRWIDRLVDFLPARVGAPARHMFHAFVGGLHALTDRRQLLYLLAYSVWLWLMLGAAFAFGALAMNLHGAYGVPFVVGGIATVTLVAIFIMVPSAPGFVGPFQLGCVAALSIFGVPKAEAAAYGVLVHIFQYMPITIVGAIYFVREGLSLSEVQHAEQPAPEAVEKQMEELERKLEAEG